MSIKKSINSFFSRLWINKSAIFKLACTYIGVVFTFWSFVSLFNPLDGILPNDISFFDKLLIGFLVLLTVFILSVFVAGCYVLSSHQVCLGESSTKNSVYVKYGDMYSPDIVEKGYNGKRAIVVSVNRCFDTIVDDHLVSHNTQHGQVFQKLYDSQKFTPDSLNRTISDILRRDTAYIDLTIEEKSKGNLRRYEVGTTVNLPIDDNLSYYLLGLSYFGYPVILPLLGSGLSRTQIDLNNIMHYLVDAFAINKDIINNDFFIVVWKGAKDRVAIKELRKWQ